LRENLIRRNSDICLNIVTARVGGTVYPGWSFRGREEGRRKGLPEERLRRALLSILPAPPAAKNVEPLTDPVGKKNEKGARSGKNLEAYTL